MSKLPIMSTEEIRHSQLAIYCPNGSFVISFFIAFFDFFALMLLKSIDLGGILNKLHPTMSIAILPKLCYVMNYPPERIL